MSAVTSATPVARLLAGKPLKDALLAQIPAATAALALAPRLVVVRVGDDPASKTFVRHKLALCAAVGFPAEEIHLPAATPLAALRSQLAALAQDTEVQAIILQLPLPAGWPVDELVNLIPAAKDCDGLTTANTTARLAGQRCIAPATPLGILRLLAYAGVPVRGATVAVVGRGRVAGQPMREMLAAAGATVIGIDKDTPHPAALCRQAGIVVSATGVPGLVTPAWVAAGATVVDVGITRVPEHGATVLKGDVDSGVAKVAGWLTPVPGGVGQLTVGSLLTNVADCARWQAGLPAFDWQIPALSPTIG